MTELMKENLLALTGYNPLNNRFNYNIGDLPFIDYLLEDKSKYPFINTVINPNTGKNYIDEDNDFLLGDSGGILMNIDFVFVNTEIFSRTAQFFTKHNRYTLEPEDTPAYDRFWKVEMDRRIRGVKAKCKLYIKDIPAYLSAKTDAERKALLHYVRITGDHYTYLNYGRIERVPNEEERKQLDRQGLIKVETIDGFPRFWDGDYWNFKIDEFIGNNKFNLCKAKARRKGFSYKRGSQAANTLNSTKNVTVTLAADIMDYLTDKGATSQMVKTNLDWFENNTNWARGYLSENFEKGIELGYKKSKDGQKAYGFRSKLLSVAIGKNESAAIGKKAIETDFEEAGKCPNLQKALDVMLSNSESGAIQVGTIRVYGTGGTKGANWEAFRLCYYNPAKNNMLPMENVWDDNARHTTCGFFFPQIWDYEPFIEDGNSLIFSAYNHDKKLKDKARKDKDSSEYVIYVGQRANRPSEAFVNTTENIFYSPELNSHIVKLQNDREYQFYTDGWYVLEDGIVKFLNKEQCIQNGIFKGEQFHEYIKDVPHNNRTDVHGCVREYYPYIPNNGDLYFIACDTYRVNKLGKDVTDKNSLYSFQVYMRSNTKYPHMSKRLVASYCGRLNSMEENDKLLLYACLRWNAKVLIEAGTGETIPNFKKWGYRNRLLKDPSYYLNRSMSLANTNDYGVVVGDGDKKLEGLSMLRDFLYEVVGYTENGTPIYQFQNIYDVSYLLECERFVYDKNWDRISTGIVAMFEFKKDSILLQRSVTETQKHNTNFAERITL